MGLMRALPEGCSDGDLVDALRDGWGLTDVDLVYVPVGGGSYHWRADDGLGRSHWVTVDDLDHKGFLGSSRDAVLDGLLRAFDTARALRLGGLEFVVAPVQTRDGTSLRLVGDRHAVTVFPYLREKSGEFGEHRTAEERAAVVDALVRLHRAPVRNARVARPEIPYRAGLETALAELDRPWSSGPYAEKAREGLAPYAADIRRRLGEFDRLASLVEATGAAPVLTHGEPHPGNVVFVEPHVLLVDWDTVGVALPERDLWMLDTDEERARYEHGSGRPVDDAAIRLYRLRWELDDIANFVHTFRSPHGEDGDTARTWTWFVGSLGSDGVWPYARGL
jgi:spectinomycin phosphotransferase